MFFRFGAAVALIVAVSLLGIALEKRTLALRRAMGRFPTGVAVATTVDLAGAPVGITVNSVSSVSLAPPLVLWSIDLRASSLEAFRGSGTPQTERGRRLPGAPVVMAG